jgi:hypothetical protein
VDHPESEVVERASKRPATRSASKTDSKKRKAEGDVSRDEPSKLTKTGRKDVKGAVDETAGVS